MKVILPPQTFSNVTSAQFTVICAEVKDKTGIIVTPGTEEESKNGWTLKSVYDEGQETLTITILEAPWPMGNYGADVQDWIASLVRGVQAG